MWPYSEILSQLPAMSESADIWCYCHAGQNNTDQWRCECVGSGERLAVVKGAMHTCCKSERDTKGYNI